MASSWAVLLHAVGDRLSMSSETAGSIYIAMLLVAAFGQQAAVFAKDTAAIGPLIDALTLSVGRVNVNAQCQRGPDTFPFTGRKSSALGTLSVSEALKTVSIESVVAMKDDASGNAALGELAASETCKSVLN